MNKKKIWISALAGILAVAVGAGIFLGMRQANRPVAVYPVSMLSYLSDSASAGESYGIVTADKVQTIYVSDTQTVTRIHTYEGQQVKKGDLLYTYDTTLSDLSLERKDLAIQQMEINLKTAKSDLTRLKQMKPMVVTTPPVSEKGRSPKDKDKYLGTCYEGTGTEGRPYLVWMTYGAAIEEDFVWDLIEKSGKKTIYVIFQSVRGDKANTEFDQEFGVVFTDITHTPEAQTTEEAAQTNTREESSGTNATTSEHTEPEGMEPTENQAPSEGTDPNPPEETENPDQETEPTVPTEPVKSFSMSFFDPNDDEVGTQIDWNSGYTQAELTAMREEKTAEIAKLEFDIKMAKAELEIMKKEASDGNVYASFDGTVVSVLEPQNAREQGAPMMKITGGGGYYVEGRVGELDLAGLRQGAEVVVTCWENGAIYTGTVTEIGTYPVEQENAGTAANVTYYPYKVFIDENANLEEGAFVSLTYQTGREQEAVLYVENAFLCTEGRDTYVYVRGSEGLLEKRYIETGPSADGFASPVYSGLTEQDWIAFPYDRELKDGMVTEESSMDTLYGY